MDYLDQDLIDYLKMNNLPILYILTKIDKIPKTKVSGIKSYFVERLNCDKNLIIPFSSLSKEGKEFVINYIEKVVMF